MLTFASDASSFPEVDFRHDVSLIIPDVDAMQLAQGCRCERKQLPPGPAALDQVRT
jgi:hypothetical protein